MSSPASINAELVLLRATILFYKVAGGLAVELGKMPRLHGIPTPFYQIA